jgi:hypothetical protein
VKNIFTFCFGSVGMIEKVYSLKEISEFMTPIEENKLKLPRSFAHNLRVIIDAENAKHHTAEGNLVSNKLTCNKEMA